jgi:hypothetical protein
MEQGSVAVSRTLMKWALEVMAIPFLEPQWAVQFSKYRQYFSGCTHWCTLAIGPVGRCETNFRSE